jgi:hypothetical protein
MDEPTQGELWTIVPDHSTVYIFCGRIMSGQRLQRSATAPLAQLKIMVEGWVPNQVAQVKVMLCDDQLESTTELMFWLQEQARAKSFALISEQCDSTIEAIRVRPGALSRIA